MLFNFLDLDDFFDLSSFMASRIIQSHSTDFGIMREFTIEYQPVYDVVCNLEGEIFLRFTSSARESPGSSPLTLSSTPFRHSVKLFSLSR